MSNARSDCEVIVAGGGPVGLCLALLLSRAGISVRVFEAEPAISLDLRASTFHPPTLDMLEPYGVTADLVSRGLVCPHWQIRLHPDGDRAVFDLSVLERETRHPYRLQCEQWKLSESLLAQLRQEGNATVVFGAAVSGVSQDEDGASVTIENDVSCETYRAKFVIGADGARSFVRKAMDLAFDGETYPETTLLVTTLFPFEEHLEGLSNVTYCWKRDGNFSLLKVPGRWRVSIYPREDLSIEEQLSEEMIEASLQEIVPRSEPYVVNEKRAYRVHQRIVARYNKGRLALAGDAAHLNSPSGGMGLNGGVHDAFELSRALTDILRHGAPLSRLDLYDRKRRPIARDQIIAQADRNRARMREKDPEKRRELLADLQSIVNDRTRLHAYLLRSSMIEGLRQAESIT
ncbi:MAG: monooxygenase FAD-binding protein [Hyphomicrobiales bacterium]|nr:monooxygenase FAD-binding protein [Hyphomicrobiales bacterium]